MVNIKPYDNVNDVDCRWLIEGVGLVFGKDIEKELKNHYQEEKEH